MLLFVAKFHTAVTKSSARGTKDFSGGKKIKKPKSPYFEGKNKSEVAIFIRAHQNQARILNFLF